MSREFSLSEMAEILSGADEHLPWDKKTVLRQLQNFVNKGLLTPSGVRLGDERNTNTFRAKSLFLARVLFILAKGGRDAGTLRAVSKAAGEHNLGKSVSAGDLIEAAREMQAKGKDAPKFELLLRNQASVLPNFDGLRVSVINSAHRSDMITNDVHATTLSIEIVDLNAVFSKLLAFANA